MRLHTSTLTREHILAAAKRAEVTVIKCETHGSRSRERAYDVALSGHGVMGGMYGNLGYATATWDEWGMFLAGLYAIDAEMIAGPYKHNREDEYESFDFLTDDRYRTLTPDAQHLRHRWTFVGIEPTHVFILGGVASYSEMECKCGAVRRFVRSYVKAVPA